MAVQSALGSSIAISATAPATQDQAGYEAVTYTAIAEVTDIPAFGDTFATITHSPLAGDGIVQKFKGSNDPGTIGVAMAVDNSDPGQILLTTALSNRNDLYTFRVTLGNGDDYYFQGRVHSRPVSPGTIDTIVDTTVEISISTRPLLVAAP